MLKKLFTYQNRLKKSHTITYKRYLYSEINFDDKMLCVFGARGVGKTTLLFQYLKELEEDSKKALYISMDYPFLSGVDLIEIVEEFVEDGGEYLLLDEIHRYNDFSSYLKTIYDLYEIKVIFTGSSATSILNAKSDLSRRVTLYNLNGFSFREYLEIKHKTTYEATTVEQIVKNHTDMSKSILTNNGNILKDFKAYLKTGYYPFYFDKQTSYYQNLLNTINLTIDIDLTSLGLIEQKYTYKLKKLLEVVCESKPFEVNYTKIAAAAEISRAKLYDYIEFLNDGQMLILVDEYVKGIKKINKPAKIYLNNTNLLFAYCENSELGTVRETFFANQVAVKNRLNIAKQGDFLVDTKYLFEVGSKGKTFKQIKGIQNSFVVADDIEIGSANKIPLWMFGMLY
ncbi:ATP-binding protein [Sulfurimonas sp. SAG-AH-194-C20]|nr:AAA family ATPase [Sulfurimonas sp. SAG-AH-194-C20]MDF1879421.1 ATP-binding protein [Sulfurimonas sp. SAG-AH-194-C20]